MKRNQNKETSGLKPADFGRLASLFSFAVFLLTAIFTFTGCPADTDNPDNPNTQIDYSGDVAIYVKKPADWSKLCAYVWDGGGKEYNGASPGAELTAGGDGFYTFRAKADYGCLNVRFSDGGASSSLDIEGIDRTVYYESTGTAYAPDDSKAMFRASDSAAFAAPRFYSGAKTSNTVTLNWDPVPGVDAYILYYTANPNALTAYFFVTAQSPATASFLDINHGQYFFPGTEYKWKLHGVKYKADLSGLDAAETENYIPENTCAAFYDTVYDYGELSVTTAESPLPAPANLRILSATAPAVELAWDAVPGMGEDDFYVVYEEDGYGLPSE